VPIGVRLVGLVVPTVFHQDRPANFQPWAASVQVSSSAISPLIQAARCAPVGSLGMPIAPISANSRGRVSVVLL